MIEPIHAMFAKKAPTPATKVKLGVGVVVLNEEGNILLERRTDCGLWGLPGGRLDPGESITQAAIREVDEETGLEVAIKKLIGIYSEPEERIVTYLDNGDVAQLVDVIVEARIVRGSLRLSEESLELAFFPPHDIPLALAPPAKAPLADFIIGLDGCLR